MATPLVTLLGAAGLSSDAIVPGQADYDNARRVWNGLFDRRPAAIVQARCVEDVQRSVSVAADAGALLAVRGGGHSFPGHSTCDEGIVLDLSGLNQVEIQATRGTARVGGGALLLDVDRASMERGLVVPAGVVSHTGVGGLTLGGGMGWNSRRYGLTIDNLVSVDLVTADGRMAKASADDEPELFWAIRGGGGNFGVVTSFEFRMRPLGDVAVVTHEFPAADACHVLAGVAEQVAAATRDLTTSFTLSRDTLRLKVLWSGRTDRTEAALAPFAGLAAGPRSTTRTSTFWQLQRSSDEALAWGRRYYAKGGFLSGIDEAVVSALTQSTAAAPTADCDVYVLQLGGAVADIGESATAYSGRSAAFYWVVNGVWDDPADDAACLAWGRVTAQGLSRLSMAGNYVNEQSDVSPEVARLAYGDETYQRLAEIKHCYDPANVFRLNQNIPPAGPLTSIGRG